MERGRTDRTGWTSWTGRTDAMGGRETRISNNEHRILNGEAEIGGVLRGGRFNRFLGCARNDNGCARNDNGCARNDNGCARNDKDWGWESGFGWGVRGSQRSKCKTQNHRAKCKRFWIPACAGMTKGIDYRRHSALRTIRGGICWGFILCAAMWEQLLLLGYQRMVKISGLMEAERFFHLLNIIAPAWLRNIPESSPSSYR